MLITKKSYFLGISWFILSLLISILNDTSMKYLSDNLSCTQIAFLRFSFSSLCLLPFMLYYGKKSFETSRIWIHVVRGLFLFIAISLWCYGLTIVPIANATLMTFTIPLFVLVMAPIFLKEKINVYLITATMIGFSGAVISLDVLKVNFDITSVLLFISAGLFAGLDIINKKFVAKESMLSMLFYSALVTSLLGFIPAYQVWQNPSLHDILILIYLGAGSNLILFCLLKAFAHVPASAVSPYRYLELVFSALIGFVMFTEIPGIMLIIGSLLIIPSTIFITFFKTKLITN